MFFFQFCRRLFFNVFSFPPSTDILIGDIHVNRLYDRCASPVLNWAGDGDLEEIEIEMVRKTEMVREMRGDGDS
jgi:hypothetical protein